LITRAFCFGAAMQSHGFASMSPGKAIAFFLDTLRVLPCKLQFFIPEK
jgi:hypothetical protein